MTEADLHPKTADDVLAAVQWAAAEDAPLEIVGQGSKRDLGRPMQTAHTLDLLGLTGVTLFEPEELVMSARAGTPLSDIKKLLDENDQEFQFEPVDLGPLLGNKPGAGTLGGLINTNFAGPRRLKSGSARDHILGISAVSGRGEIFKSGGRVVKNVTGYDLSKGVTGSWGTLAVLTDITMKVLPRSETEKTLVLEGLSDSQACEAMAVAMGSNGEVSAAAHVPGQVSSKSAATYFRIEGFEPSVAYRMENLSKLLADFGHRDQLAAGQSRAKWKALRDCMPFANDQTPSVWRISCIPSEGWCIVADLKKAIDCSAYYDWQGGLIWLAVTGDDAHADAVRLAIASNGGGHATLIRASADIRQSVDVFQPQPKPLAALSRRYRENFDPKGILNPGRMG